MGAGSLRSTVANAPAASAQPRSFAARARPRAGRTCAATTDARPTTRRAAHQNSRECSGHVPTRSLSWAARTSVANSVHRMQHSTKPQTRRVLGGAGQWLQWAVTGATCNTGCSVAAQTSRVFRVPPVSTQSTPYTPVRALSRAASGAHGYARRGGAVSGVGPAPSAGFRLGLPRAARTRSCGHTPVSTRSTPM